MSDVELTSEERGHRLAHIGDDQYIGECYLEWDVERIIAARVVAARAEALREAADILDEEWAKNGSHYGQPGCYSSGYSQWLRRRAAALDTAADPDTPTPPDRWADRRHRGGGVLTATERADLTRSDWANRQAVMERIIGARLAPLYALADKWDQAPGVGDYITLTEAVDELRAALDTAADPRAEVWREVEREIAAMPWHQWGRDDWRRWARDHVAALDTAADPDAPTPTRWERA